MPIDSKECFAALTEDGQLWEIYQAAQTGGGGGGITSINGDTTAAQIISGTAPITASTAAGTTTISTSMNTARLLGRTTAGVGVAEEISVGTGLSLAGGTLTNTIPAGVTSVTATAPLTSSGGATPDISTSIATNRIVGRSTAGTGVMEQLTPVGITVSGGNITGIGGTVGTVDNAVPRADGTGGFTAQGSDIVIDDATTSTQNNVAITNQHASQTNSALVLTPKGTGALIAGPKPDGTATGGNARGSKAICLVGDRSAATQVASGPNSVAIGYRATASGTTSLAISGAASGASSIAIVGTASGDNAVALGGSAGSWSVAIGRNSSAGNFGGIAVGDNCSAATGYAFGSTSASGDKAISIGLNNTATQYACIAIGRQNNSTGSTDSICIGENNTSSSSRSCSIGAENSSSGGYGLAIGRSNTSLATYSLSKGFQSEASRFGMEARASGRFAANGDAQRARFVLRCKTTTNAAVEMALDGSTTYLGIPSGKVIACTINISGVKSDGSAVAHYVRQYAVKNVGGTSSEVYAPVTIGTDNAAGTVIALSANNADDTLRIAVTGIAAEIWRWVASVDAVEIAYGT